MNVREWALIAFSIMAQMSVGSFLVLGVVHFFARIRAGEEEADRLSDRALLAIGPVMILALVASLFHLGTPLNAYKAVANVGSSWLSREILFGVIFTVLGGAFALMQWRKIGTFNLRAILAWAAAAVGLVLVYSMARVYMLRTVPTWNTLATPVSFFTTTFLLGALATGAAFVANFAYFVRKEGSADAQKKLLRDALRWIAVASIAFLGVEFVLIPLNLADLAAGPAVAAATVSELMEQYGLVLGLRLLFVFLGAGIFGLFLYRNALSPGREAIMGNLAYSAFVLVLVSEVLGRFLFYASYARIGV